MKSLKLNNKTYFFIVIITLVILISNLFYGFGWADEALYASIPFSIYQGKQLFFDIWEPTQFYSLLLYPFLKIYIILTNSTEGIYLYFRFITLALQLITYFMTYLIFSRKRENNRSLYFVLLLFLIYSRASISGPSYYMICLFSFILAIDFIYSVFILKWNSFLLLVVGIFLSISALCNPYLAIIYFIFTIIIFSLKKTRKEYKKILLIYLGIFLSAFIYLCIILKNHTLSEFLNSLKYVLTDPDYSGKTLFLRIKWFLKFPRLLITPFLYYFIFTILSIICILKKDFREKYIRQRRNKIFLLILLVINYLSIIIYKKDCGSPIVGFCYLPFFIISLFTNFNLKGLPSLFKQYKLEILFFIIPGLCLSFMECLCSDTGFGVFALGMIICFFGITPIFFSVLDQVNLPIKKLFTICILLLTFLGTIYYRTNLSYRETNLRPHLIFIPSFHKNISKIDKGPAKGLYTSKSNYEAYSSIYDSLKSIEYKKGDSILISKLVPWGYLVNLDLKSNAPTSWRVPFNYQRLHNYYEIENHPFPDFILHIDESIRDNNSNPIENSLLSNMLIQKNYTSKKLNCGTLYYKQN